MGLSVDLPPPIAIRCSSSSSLSFSSSSACSDLPLGRESNDAVSSLQSFKSANGVARLPYEWNFLRVIRGMSGEEKEAVCCLFVNSCKSKESTDEKLVFLRSSVVVVVVVVVSWWGSCPMGTLKDRMLLATFSWSVALGCCSMAVGERG